MVTDTCGPGYEKDGDQCVSCKLGHVKGQPGDHACVPCPAGSVPNEMATSCIECPSGAYTNTEGQKRCYVCYGSLTSDQSNCGKENANVE